MRSSPGRHTGVTSVHAAWLVAVHVTQAPVEAHARPWVLAEQSLSLAAAAARIERALAVLQTGAGFEPRKSFTHCAHVWVAVSQALLEQSVFCMQPTHTPAGTSQTWLVPPAQSAAEAQPRQVPAAVSQKAVGATHAEWSVASHWTHSPAFVPPSADRRLPRSHLPCRRGRRRPDRRWASRR